MNSNLIALTCFGRQKWAKSYVKAKNIWKIYCQNELENTMHVNKFESTN